MSLSDHNNNHDTDHASDLYVILSNAPGENGEPSMEYVGSNVDLDFMDDERLSISSTGRSITATCFISGIEVATFYVAHSDLDTLVMKYKLTRTLHKVLSQGSRPENFISWPEFVTMLHNNVALTESAASLSSAELFDDIDNFDGDYVTIRPDLDNLDGFSGPVNLIAHMNGGIDDEVWNAFVIPEVEEPTLVRKPGARTNAEPAVLVLPSVSHKWNDAIRWWCYQEELSAVTMEFIFTEDDEVVVDELLPAVNLVPLTEEGEKRVLEIGLARHDYDDDEDDVDA